MEMRGHGPITASLEVHFEFQIASGYALQMVRSITEREFLDLPGLNASVQLGHLFLKRKSTHYSQYTHGFNNRR